MPTILDVAQEAGVSIATVSRVLNQSCRVRPETKERVLRAVENLQYAPDASAKNLRSRRTNLVGVVVPDVSVEFYMELIKGIENTAINSEYNLIICDSQNDPNREIEYIRLLTERRVDGMILTESSMTDDQIAALVGKGFPLVLIGRELPGGGASSVSASNRYGAGLAIEHLIGHGHERIAYIRGIRGGQDEEERFSGYQSVLARHGMAFDPQLVEWGGFTEEGGARALEKLLARRKFSAVFAANDEMAIGVMGKARELGLNVPEDLAVVGFDNIRLAHHVHPGLTTVDQPKYNMGAAAARKLLNMLTRGEIVYEKAVLRTELILRRSCGCR
ncbi:MAG: LacI family DNA-binding transcriptional regulator [Bacteroidota bacterium]